MGRVAELSVAISTRDRPDALARCLESLASGDARPGEVVIVDQSSGDETLRLVEACRQHLPIRYLRQAPLGLAVSQNAAVAACSRPVVAVIDDDCIAERSWLATLEGVFGGSEELDVVTGRVLPLPATGDRVYPVASRTSEERRDFSGKTLPWPVGGGNNFALKRAWFDRIGGCDERLGPGSPGEGGMDLDLFYRLLRAGARIRYEPDALVRHERQTRAGRLARRPMYGHGMGASCVFRLREGDGYAVRMLAHWVLFRCRLLAGALRRREWMGVREEWMLLRGTARGVLHGLLAPRSVGPRGAVSS